MGCRDTATGVDEGLQAGLRLWDAVVRLLERMQRCWSGCGYSQAADLALKFFWGVGVHISHSNKNLILSPSFQEV